MVDDKRASFPLDEKSTLFVVCLDDVIQDETFAIIKETLMLMPNEKLVIIPYEWQTHGKAIPEVLLVQFPEFESCYFQQIMLDILYKRRQTTDLISMMRELQRSFDTVRAGVIITDRLSSLPRLQRPEKEGIMELP